jgi:hypothetical protein
MLKTHDGKLRKPLRELTMDEWRHVVDDLQKRQDSLAPLFCLGMVSKQLHAVVSEVTLGACLPGLPKFAKRIEIVKSCFLSKVEEELFFCDEPLEKFCTQSILPKLLALAGGWAELDRRIKRAKTRESLPFRQAAAAARRTIQLDKWFASIAPFGPFGPEVNTFDRWASASIQLDLVVTCAPTKSYEFRHLKQLKVCNFKSVKHEILEIVEQQQLLLLLNNALAAHRCNLRVDFDSDKLGESIHLAMVNSYVHLARYFFYTKKPKPHLERAEFVAKQIATVKWLKMPTTPGGSLLQKLEKEAASMFGTEFLVLYHSHLQHNNGEMFAKVLDSVIRQASPPKEWPW